MFRIFDGNVGDRKKWHGMGWAAVLMRQSSSWDWAKISSSWANWRESKRLHAHYYSIFPYSLGVVQRFIIHPDNLIWIHEFFLLPIHLAKKTKIFVAGIITSAHRSREVSPILPLFLKLGWPANVIVPSAKYKKGTPYLSTAFYVFIMLPRTNMDNWAAFTCFFQQRLAGSSQHFAFYHFHLGVLTVHFEGLGNFSFFLRRRWLVSPPYDHMR